MILRTHPATVTHHSAVELPAATKRQKVLAPAELQRWLRSIYTRYNPQLLPKAGLHLDAAAARSQISWTRTKERNPRLLRVFVENTGFHRHAAGTEAEKVPCISISFYSYII